MPAVLCGFAIAALTFGVASAQDTPPTPTPAPAAAGAATAEPAALCGDFHEDQSKAFPANPHARLPKLWRPTAAKPNALCESCHGDGAAHIESGGEKPLIRGFQTRADSDTCLSCHLPRGDHSGLRGGIHTNSEAGHRR